MPTFLETLKTIPGLTHYYPLATDTKDVIGSAHGLNTGVRFASGRAVFNGDADVKLPDHNDFSVATKGGLTILAFVAINDWRGKGASEYVHWMGKGKPGAHEWTFRHYIKGGSGEASSRVGRTSFYHFNPSGGLGAGSYYQDSSCPTYERIFVATCDLSKINLYVDGALRDTDALSGYKIKPVNTGTPVMLGTRGDNTGYLIGKMRDVAFFSRALTTNEIVKIYDARNLARTALSVPPEEEPPVAPPPAEDYQANVLNLLAKHNALAKVLREKGIV